MRPLRLRASWLGAIAATAAAVTAASPASAQVSFADGCTARIPVDRTEPGDTTRTDEYGDVTRYLSGAPLAATSEVRVALGDGTELPSLVRAANGALVSVVFPRTVAQGATERVYVYWS